MNIYIGNDILKISRIKEKDILSKTFLSSAFSEAELNYVKEKENTKYESLAGMFSAKESLIKVFSKIYEGTLSIRDFEILHDGKIPYVNILNKDLKEYENNVDISISHDGDYTSTTAILLT